MRNKISLREIVLGAILLTATMLLIGCISKNPCNVDKAYDFASMVSKEDPNKFAKERSKKSIIYHDKSLTVKGTLFVGSWPTEGKGIFIEIYEDGKLSVSEWDCNQMAKLASGEIKPSEAKGKSFGYMNDEDIGEVITLWYNDSMVSYIKSSGKWEKNCYDVSKFDVEMEFESSPFGSLPILSKKSVKEEEVLRFLELVRNIRERYPIN